MAIDLELARTLCRLNSDFYLRQYQSFSDTRRQPWPGWQRCLDLIGDADAARSNGWALASGDLTVLDLAAGNMRFAVFLGDALPGLNFTVYAVDNCPPLAVELPQVVYRQLDIAEALLTGSNLSELLLSAPVDLAVCFGFMHHLPLHTMRVDALAALLQKTRPGGFVCASFWQFMSDAGLAAGALITSRQALAELSLPNLDKNDYLLGWQGKPGVYRYCHSFSDDEIDRLIASLPNHARLVGRFKSDGRTGELNTYLIWQAGGEKDDISG